MRGFDCATPLTAETAAAFKADGFDFACRYLVPERYNKALTRREAEALSAAGVQIVSVYETYAERALGGREAGLNDGFVAAQCAHEIGQPDGSCIYAAVDFQPEDAAQMALVVDYIRGFSEATPTYTTGVYGSYAVLNAVRDAAACSHYWQTYAWSNKKTCDFMHIYQHQNGLDAHGIGYDLDASYGDEGAWVLAVPQPAPQPEPQQDTPQPAAPTDYVTFPASEDWKHSQLGNALTELSKLGGGTAGDTQLLSYEWAEQAYRRELSVSDAIRVLAVALARSKGVDVE